MTPRPKWAARLRPREYEVATFVAQGKSNKDIAKRLNIKIYTVKVHLTRAYAALDISNRVELAVMVVKGGR